MQSIEVIYRQYASVIYRYLFAKIRDENIAEEVTQETFYQAIRCSDKFDYSCKVSTWLCALSSKMDGTQITRTGHSAYAKFIRHERN